MAKKHMRVERKKRPSKKLLEEKVDFLRQLAEKHIPLCCFKEYNAVQEAYRDIKRYIRNTKYR